MFCQVNQGSLYPALYRLENQGWIKADWGVSELGRRARFYHLTASGRKQLGVETADWGRLTRAIGKILEQRMRGLFPRLRALFFRRRTEQELDEELNFHIEMQTRKNRALGMDPEQARRNARVQFGANTIAVRKNTAATCVPSSGWNSSGRIFGTRAADWPGVPDLRCSPYSRWLSGSA